MSFESAQAFVQKMKEDRVFRSSIQQVKSKEALWHTIQDQGFGFDERELISAMASCMAELEASQPQ